jgi:hypothetical protein
METTLFSNFKFLIEAEGDKTNHVFDVLIDYPGYIGVDGSLEANLGAQPSEGVLDLALSTTLYYETYPQDQIQQVLLMFPMMETMLASQVSLYSGENLTLTRLEVSSSNMGSSSATLMIEGRLEGNFQKGIRAILSNLGEDYYIEGFEFEQIPELQIGSYRASLEYFEENSIIELIFDTSILSNIDEWANFIKNSVLDEVLEEGYANEEDKAVINEFLLPTELSVANLLLQLDYEIMDDTIIYTFNLEGLMLKPPSLESFMSFLEYVSDHTLPDDFVLILEGGTSGGKNVLINSPAETSQPISQESQKVVWDLSEAENLDQVNFEVESTTMGNLSTNLIIGAVGIVIILAIAIYIMQRRS